ncbi:chemotaxis protein CheW [Actinokineospora inagensis]|uniref:chemotaxis protein CheW n=1 Tax=Actinokineospora inagensis TaxID=103730 RepID=UPI0004073CAE|nr:chemotaxis protein CheW [Actinokineospora inagensis]
MTGVDLLYGAFLVDGRRIALPLSQLREVIPAPDRLEPLPIRSAAVRGAVTLRHLAIPVLSLRDLVGGDPTGEPEVIVVAAHDGHVIGLLADEILGVESVVPDDLFHLRFAGASDGLFSTSFESAAGLVSILDFDAVTALPGVPSVRDRGRQEEELRTHQRETGASLNTVLLLRCAETRLCVGVEHVHSVVPELRVKPSPMAKGACVGVAEVGDSWVAVVDTLALLGLGTQAELTRGVCLRLGRGMVVLAVGEVTNVASIVSDDIMPPPRAVRSAMPFLAGTLTENDVQHLVIDSDAVVADPEVLSLGALTLAVVDTPDEAPAVVRETDDTGRAVRPATRSMLTYRAGIEVATDLMQINEVLDYPADVLPVSTPGILGLFTHRGSAVPLVELADALGKPETGSSERKVLLVGTGTDLVGFVVSALHAIEDSVWEETAGSTHPRGFPLIRVSGDGPARTLPEVSLVDLGTTRP